MSPLLEQAFTEIQQLPESLQLEIASIILEIIQHKQNPEPEKTPYFLSPALQGSGYTDTAANHDQVIAESLLHHHSAS